MLRNIVPGIWYRPISNYRRTILSDRPQRKMAIPRFSSRIGNCRDAGETSISQLIIRDERIDSAVYDVPYMKESEEEAELRQVSEGTAIPESRYNLRG
jgi:hypothetical protein